VKQIGKFSKKYLSGTPPTDLRVAVRRNTAIPDIPDFFLGGTSVNCEVMGLPHMEVRP
jgi:hypothetical protein